MIVDSEGDDEAHAIFQASFAIELPARDGPEIDEIVEELMAWRRLMRGLTLMESSGGKSETSEH